MAIVRLSQAGLTDYQKSNSMLSGNDPVSFGAYELIESNILTSSASSVTFSSIPQDYKHLQIRAVARTDFTSSRNIRATFNSDTGANYALHFLYGSGSSVLSSGSTSQTSVTIGEASGTGTTNVWYPSVADILDYSSSNKNTTTRSLSSSTLILLRSGLWLNTAAITSINLFPTSNNFVSGSRFSLYGVKG